MQNEETAGLDLVFQKYQIQPSSFLLLCFWNEENKRRKVDKSKTRNGFSISHLRMFLMFLLHGCSEGLKFLNRRK